MTRRIRVVWRRARRTGRDLDAAAYAAFVTGGALLLAALTGALGPSLDAHAASSHSARSASADRATF
ncbi:Uncharacterised protein [Achromobacter sp. 2789STDY5608633]|uniref:hypothetical protein n=1 Tax=Achromobacter sp. 2789STDY5608633 TaxID=1806501 RepID=UPI0006BFC7A3|nr:hypothetical protein [Achromobacter sp. 2789STDY5608633]CUJ46877.1 Uncharacterised protein [Achromobacter sp. 2789STDY5608633]